MKITIQRQKVGFRENYSSFVTFFVNFVEKLRAKEVALMWQVHSPFEVS